MNYIPAEVSCYMAVHMVKDPDATQYLHITVYEKIEFICDIPYSI